MGKFRIYDAYLHLQGQYLFLCEKIQKNPNSSDFSSKKSFKPPFLTQSSLEMVKSHFLTKNYRISTISIEGIVWKLL